MKKPIILVILALSIMIVLITCNKEDNQEDDIELETGTFADQRDGQTYKWVKIGDQVWMAENLRYLPSVAGPETESLNTPYYYVYGYNGTDVNAAKAKDNYLHYGVLYNWPAAMAGAASSNTYPSGVQGVCPPGWHVPSHDEWTQLEQYICTQLGNSDCITEFPYDNATRYWRGINEGNALKSCSQVNSPLGGACDTSVHPRWDGSTHYGSDEFGFSALPGGVHRTSGSFLALGIVGYWWSATEDSSTRAWSRGVSTNSGNLTRPDDDKRQGLSVRCVKDN